MPLVLRLVAVCAGAWLVPTAALGQPTPPASEIPDARGGPVVLPSRFPRRPSAGASPTGRAIPPHMAPVPAHLRASERQRDDPRKHAECLDRAKAVVVPAALVSLGATYFYDFIFIPLVDLPRYAYVATTVLGSAYWANATYQRCMAPSRDGR